jgi:hypothetical protein
MYTNAERFIQSAQKNETKKNNGKNNQVGPASQVKQNEKQPLDQSHRRSHFRPVSASASGLSRSPVAVVDVVVDNYIGQGWRTCCLVEAQTPKGISAYQRKWEECVVGFALRSDD